MSNAATLVKVGSVYKNSVKPVKMVSQFSVYPNPSKDGIINLLIPANPVSVESNTFKFELYNALGNRILKKENLLFDAHHMPIGLEGKGSGIYLLKITSGEEVKVLKILVN
jgi:hypothetical protein